MFHRKSLTVALAVLVFGLSGFLAAPVCAQGGESIEEMKARVSELVKQFKYTETLPWLEKLVVAEPDNERLHYYLGFALLAEANTKDPPARKALSLRARAAFLRAKELAINEPIVDAMIAAIPADGSYALSFSQNIAADSLMVEAEAFFAQGKLDDALKNYQKALEFDPKLYHAALFAGDVFIQKRDYPQGLAWYERAIAIDPNRETAYRYSATPLMREGKTEAARDRYIEAFITEPYSKLALAGLLQWAQVTGTQLAHPIIDIPSNVTFDEKGDAKISLDANTLTSGKEDGSFAWIAYGGVRSIWHKEMFAKTFPTESAYRHSLPEEAEALRSVLGFATREKAVKTLSPSLAKLKALNDAGLLEAFILLARPDEGIAQDFPGYLKTNRDKLRRYMVECALTGGGDPKSSSQP